MEINIVLNITIYFAPPLLWTSLNFSLFSTSYHKLPPLLRDIQVHILVSGRVHKLWTFDKMKSLESPLSRSEQIAQ